tara:strand:+ start:1148 stop:1369 length:222 start_codon:yes stop_codon:yes gene_type:complete
MTRLMDDEVIIVHLTYQRQTENINSFLTLPIELRKEWVDKRLVSGMAAMIKDFRNLKGWEFICYHHDKIMEDL